MSKSLEPRPGVIDWDLIDKKYNWVAMDEDGKWFAMMTQPELGNCTWVGGGPCRMDELNRTVNWKLSLTERPKVSVNSLEYLREGVKFDTDKIQWRLLPWAALKLVVEVLMFGAKKYSPENWKLVDNAEERYKEAAMRHLVAVFEGEWLDLESGKPHLAHLICCALFVLSLHKDTTD